MVNKVIQLFNDVVVNENENYSQNKIAVVELYFFHSLFLQLTDQALRLYITVVLKYQSVRHQLVQSFQLLRLVCLVSSVRL